MRFIAHAEVTSFDLNLAPKDKGEGAPKEQGGNAGDSNCDHQRGKKRPPHTPVLG